MSFWTGEDLDITIATGIDLTGYSVARIYYRDPAESVGYWTADSVSGTTVAFQLTAAANILVGKYHAQVYIVDGSTEEAIGDKVYFVVERSIKTEVG